MAAAPSSATLLTRPPWAQFNDAQRQQLTYLWDDARAWHDFRRSMPLFLPGVMKLSVRARLAVAAGLFESIVWRFDGLHHRPEPRLIAEAAWCATVDPRYLRCYELTRDEWLGPVEGPLWCAVAWLQAGVPKGDLFELDLYDSLVFLMKLALHVAPQPDQFEPQWREILTRWSVLFPPLPDDPFADLFGVARGARLGPIVGRALLDPAAPLSQRRDKDFLDTLLRHAHATQNPFLATPDELDDLHFAGPKYCVPVTVPVTASG